MQIFNNYKIMHLQVFQVATSQAIFDICFTIGSIKNIGYQWTPRFNFCSYFELQKNGDYASPYQIIQDKKNWNSSIDLSNYISGSITLGPMQQKPIYESCTFRTSIPINILQEQELTCFIQIYAQDKLITTLKYCFQNIVGLCSYIPIFQINLGIIVQAKLQVQLLGLRGYKNFQEDINEDMLKFIDNFFHQSKRLMKKLKNFTDQQRNFAQTNQHNKTNHMSQIGQIRQKNMDNRSVIDRLYEYNEIEQTRDRNTEGSSEIDKLYQQYQKIKGFKQSRIFKGKSKNQHRYEIINFVRKIRDQHIVQLQVNWQNYLKYTTTIYTKKILMQLKRQYVLDLAYEIKNKIIRNKSLEKSSQCQLIAGQVKKNIEGLGIVKVQNLLQIDHLQDSISLIQVTGKHLIILVHGYGASSLAMSLIERAIRYYYPEMIILSSKSNQLIDQNSNIESMGRNLAIQIEQYMQQFSDSNDLQISFIGHSLGGLIIRSALTHLQVFKLNMCSFISLSAPHLGHICHTNKIAKVGMIAINAFQHSKVIDDLFLKSENKQQRLSYLYNLSSHSGLSWFKNVVFYGCKNDGYVSISSALVQGMPQKKKISQQMSHNIRQIIKQTKHQRFQVSFEHQKSDSANWQQFLIGRASHIAFTTNEAFITFFLLQNHKYFKVSSQQDDSD